MLLEEVDNPYHFNKGRYMSDYSAFFKDELTEIKSATKKTKGQQVKEWNIKGRFLRENY